MEDVRQMNMNMVQAKYEAVFPFDILMKETVSKDIVMKWEGLGQAVIHAPELIDSKKLKEGRYRSRLLADVTLDVDTKPADLSFDRFFGEKCIEALIAVLIEMWHHTKALTLDPHLPPIFAHCDYYDSTGSPFVSPDTGRSSYEEQLPRGMVLSRNDWKTVGDNLATGKRRNLDETLLLDAMAMYAANRPELAIVLVAMACEHKVKYVCTRLAEKKGIPNEFWDMLVNKMRPPVRRYYEDIMVELGVSPIDSSLLKRLKQLFDHRNNIAHFGTIRGYASAPITPEELFSLADLDIRTGQQFLRWLDLQETTLK